MDALDTWLLEGDRVTVPADLGGGEGEFLYYVDGPEPLLALVRLESREEHVIRCAALRPLPPAAESAAVTPAELVVLRLAARGDGTIMRSTTDKDWNRAGGGWARCDEQVAQLQREGLVVLVPADNRDRQRFGARRWLVTALGLLTADPEWRTDTGS